MIKLGVDILPLLPEKEEGLSAEQKRRLTTVRATLKGAEAQKNIQPRLCTIQNQAIPLSKALEELTKQTEIKVEDGRPFNEVKSECLEYAARLLNNLSQEHTDETLQHTDA